MTVHSKENQPFFTFVLQRKRKATAKRTTKKTPRSVDLPLISTDLILFKIDLALLPYAIAKESDSHCPRPARRNVFLPARPPRIDARRLDSSDLKKDAVAREIPERVFSQK